MKHFFSFSMAKCLLTLSTLTLICSSSSGADLTLNQGDSSKVPSTMPVLESATQRRFVKILSIDGGGVRGIIPALILENLESRLPKGSNLGEKFDIIAGTSSGGIIGFMLSVPGEDGKPKYTASFITKEINKVIQSAFSRSIWKKLSSCNGWLGTKYDESSFQVTLQSYFGDTKLSQTVTNVIVPAYEIEKDKTFFFKSARARKEPSRDYRISEIAYATSAAPTYFKPARISNVTNKCHQVLIDGGVAANNPTVAAIVHAIELYGYDIDLFVVSIGTGTNYGATSERSAIKKIENSGKLGWANDIVSLLMYTDTSVTDYEAYYVMNYKKPQRYFRLQTILEPQYSDFDNISTGNLEALKKYANDIIQKHESELNYIASVLHEPYKPFHEEAERNTFN